MQNEFRDKMMSADKPLGTFFNIGDLSTMEALGYTGLDFVIVDTEHGHYDTETMGDLISAAAKGGMEPLVRIADVTHKEIQRAADNGARGLIVPCLRTMDEMEKLVDLAKFQPIGNRGFIFGRGSGFGNEEWAAQGLPAYMANSNDRLLVLPQCETVECLEIIEDVTAMEGIDGIFIGPFDLSITMGIPGQFDHPDFAAALTRIQEACKSAGKPCMIYANGAEDTRLRLEQGFDAVATGLTSVFFVQVYKDLIADIKR